MIDIQASGQACGASVTGLDLRQKLSEIQVQQIRAAWLQHHVLAFPNQDLNNDDLERFTLSFGAFGEDPFIASIKDRKHIIAVERAANETTPIFAEAWHTDWSFQKEPPSGTCLYGITIPPVGGDTLFVNQHKAYQAMHLGMREKYQGLQAIHSARLAYSPEGMYGVKEYGRTMDIKPSAAALETQTHPLVRAHQETGELGFYGTAGYVIGIEGMSDKESEELLMELHQWQIQPQFQYRHQWQEKMLLMWDNRSLLHRATGGFQGHARLLHRTTIGAAAQ